MMLTGKDYLEEAITAVQFNEGGEFRPTLVIGLGGSGVNTARRLKRLLRERYQIKGLISFLYVDTDQGQYQSDPELADVEPSESAKIIVSNASQLLAEYRQNRKLHPYFESILDDSLDVTMLHKADGAAGIRPVGRFALHASFGDLYSRFLEPALHNIMRVQELTAAMMQGVPKRVEVTHFQPRVYIISSLCGGTGSAVFMDVAIVMRHIMEQNGLDGELVGIFYLPSIFRRESGISMSLMEVIEANAYASLMELEFLCDPNNLNQEWSFHYPMLGKIRLQEPVLDEVFLVEGTNAAGQFLSNKYHAFEMTARSLLLDLGSPIGARARSAKRNALAVIETIPCAETGLPRLMNSLAVTNLSVPVDELLRYCAARAARELYDMGPTQSTETGITAEVESFLRTKSLEERGSSDQIIERILSGDAGEPLAYKPPSTSSLLEKAEGAGQRATGEKAGFLAEELDTLFQRVKDSWLLEMQKRIDANALQVQQQALDDIGNHCEMLFEKNGHDYVIRFFQELINIFGVVRNELLKEVKTYEDQTLEAERRLQRELSTLRELKRQKKSLLQNLPFWQGQDVELVLQRALQELSVYANSALRRKATQATIELLDPSGEGSLLHKLEGWKRLVGNWKTHETHTNDILLEKMATRRRERSGNNYELEWLAMLREDFDAFYNSLSIPFEEIRRRHLDLKRDFEHYPAFGKLQSTRVDSETEAQIRIAAAAEVLRDQIREKANILDVIEHVNKEGETRVRYLERKLKMLFDVCQPFWTTSDAPGEPLYEIYVAVSVPPATNSKKAEELESTVRNICSTYGVNAELVHDGFPYAITVMKRAYGARAYYLRSSSRMKTFYDRRAKDAKVYARLHVDRQFQKALEPLHPIYHAEETYQLWAWGVAFGYIAQAETGFYLGIQKLRRGLIAPKYATDWQLALTEHLPPEWQTRVLKRYDKDDLLASSRRDALDAFLKNEEHQKKVRDARKHLRLQLTIEQEIDLLENYTDKLVQEINNSTDRALSKLLSKEKDAIRNYIVELEEQKG